MTSRRLVSGLLVAFGAVIFSLTAVTSAWTAPKYRVLHAFGVGKDGAGIWGSLILDKKGNLYGMTGAGGFFGWGTAFELTPESKGRWSETILHSFNRNGRDGYGSTANLTFDTVGDLYGTTGYGGIYDAGTVFQLVPGSNGWAEKVLYSFGSHKNDAFNPYAGVAIDRAGNLYGTGHSVYEVVPGGWTERVIHDFTRKQGDGGGPFAGVILDSEGSLYGTTEGGGAYQAGTVYRLTAMGSGRWKERILYDFCPAGLPCADGAIPGLGVLAMDHSGNLYGATEAGGTSCGCGGCGSCGVVYTLTRGQHGHWTESVLYHFQSGASGFGPGAGVVRDQVGNLYGTTLYGGSSQCGCGVIYKLSPRAGGKWKYSVLHAFIGSDGAQPDANMILDDNGNLYGTSATGGSGGAGVVFELTP